MVCARQRLRFLLEWHAGRLRVVRCGLQIMIGHAVTELHDLKAIEQELKDLGQRHAE